MKIHLTVSDTSCVQGFVTSEGQKFLFPGQDFKPEHDQFKIMLCPEVYKGPEIKDMIDCSGGGGGGRPDGIAFIVIDSVTQLPIEGALLDVKLGNTTVFAVETDVTGVAFYDADPGVYIHQAGASGYIASDAIQVGMSEGQIVEVVIPLDPIGVSVSCDILLSLNLWTHNPTTGNFTSGFTNIGTVPVTVTGFFLNSIGASVVSASPPLGTVIAPMETMSYTVDPGSGTFTGASIITDRCGIIIHDDVFGGADTCHLHAEFKQVFFPEFSQKIILRNTGTNTMTVTIEVPDDTGDWVVDLDPGPYVLSPGEVNEVPVSQTFDNGTAPDPPRFPLNPTVNLHTNNCGDFSLYLGTTIPPYGTVIVQFVWENEGSSSATFLANGVNVVEGGTCPPDVCLPMTEGAEDSYSSGDTGDVKVTTDVVSSESGFPEDHFYGVHGHAYVSLQAPGAIGAFTVTASYDEGDGPPLIIGSWKYVPVIPLSSVTAYVVITPAPWMQDPNSEEVAMIPSGPATTKVTFGSAL